MFFEGSRVPPETTVTMILALTEIALAKAAKQLAKRDKDLASILKRLGPPPLWARPPGFSTLIKIILEQQVSLASAASIFARLEKA